MAGGSVSSLLGVRMLLAFLVFLLQLWFRRHLLLGWTGVCLGQWSWRN